MIYYYITDKSFSNFFKISAQKELLIRAHANGLATQGLYKGGVSTFAAGEDNFVAQHAY